jgi:hypothetical protein
MANAAGRDFFEVIKPFPDFRQHNALMTCIVPSPLADDHMHFIDRAAGGYAIAAAMLKKMIVGAEKRL